MVVLVQGMQVGPHLDLRMLPYRLTGYVKVIWRCVYIFLVILQEFSVMKCGACSLECWGEILVIKWSLRYKMMVDFWLIWTYRYLVMSSGTCHLE